MLFIDSQEYLDLYRMNGGKTLLRPLETLKDRVFVTAQVADEVTRNKLDAACEYLTNQFKGLAQGVTGIPDHLFSGPVSEELKDKLAAAREAVNDLRKRLTVAVEDLLEQIGRSEDEVSKALAFLFDRAVEVSEAELGRAKQRKERGRAPGKKGDPLGDQINWEQVLTRAKGWPEVWIISKDRDFCSKCNDRVILNPALYRDLAQARPGIKVHCFTELLKGLQDFANANPVPDLVLPSREESDRINREQEMLPGLSRSGVWKEAPGALLTALSGFANVTPIEPIFPQGSGVSPLLQGLFNPGPAGVLPLCPTVPAVPVLPVPQTASIKTLFSGNPRTDGPHKPEEGAG